MSKHTPVIEHEYPVLEHEYTTQRTKDVQDLGIESSHNQGRTTGLVQCTYTVLSSAVVGMFFPYRHVGII